MAEGVVYRISRANLQGEGSLGAEDGMKGLLHNRHRVASGQLTILRLPLTLPSGLPPCPVSANTTTAKLLSIKTPSNTGGFAYLSCSSNIKRKENSEIIAEEMQQRCNRCISTDDRSVASCLQVRQTLSLNSVENSLPTQYSLFQ